MIETKISGRAAGSTLVVVLAKGRDGNIQNVVADQTYKIFIAARLPIN